MCDLKSAMEDLMQELRAELRAGFLPAYENIMAFIYTVDWKEPFVMCVLGFHFVLLLIAIVSRGHVNFQMFLFLLSLLGVFFTERINRLLSENWKAFATKNYFDPQGVFLSTLWSGPLLIISLIILINTLFSLCIQIVQWKRAELRHRANLAQKKEE